MNPRIKLRHLSCFAEVAHRRSVTGAAHALFITQSAVSRALAELEEILGAPLLRRRGQGTTLTRFGEVFLRHVEQALAMIHQGEEAVAQVRGIGGLQLAMGVLPYIGVRIVPQAVCEFMREHPDTAVRVITIGNSVLLTMLKTGELDLVVSRLGQAKDMEGLNFEHLYSERLALAARPGHPLLKPRRGKRQKSQRQLLREVGEHTVVFLPPGSSVRDVTDRLFIQNGVTLPARRVETEETALARGMIEKGDAIWCVPQRIIEKDLKAGTLAEIPANMDETSVAVGVSVRAAAPIPPHCAALIHKVRESTAVKAKNNL